MKRIAIYNHYKGCGKTFIANLLANWLEKEKKANVVFQIFDINAEPDICDVVKRDSEGEGYYIMDFLWDDRVPKAFRYLLKKGLVDCVIIPIQIDAPWTRVRLLFTSVFLKDDGTYESLETKRPQFFCLWNRVPGTLLYDKDYKFFNAEKALVSNGFMVCSSRVREMPSMDTEELIKRRFGNCFREVIDRIDNPYKPEWQSSWVEDLENFSDLPLERKNKVFEKMVDNGLHDGCFTFPAPIDPKTGKPIELPPDPADEEAYDAFWKKAGD